jgi:hypothetical protein
MRKKESKQPEQAKPDVEYQGSAQAREINVKQAGKAKITVYSNIEYETPFTNNRLNLPDNVKDGEQYRDVEITVKKGVTINPDKAFKKK